jgi:hypothetical protein
MAFKRPSENTAWSELLDTTGIPRKSEPDPPGPMLIRNIRISESDWQLLRQHFGSKRLSVSAGIRMVVKDYLQQLRQCPHPGGEMKIIAVIQDTKEIRKVISNLI